MGFSHCAFPLVIVSLNPAFNPKATSHTVCAFRCQMYDVLECNGQLFSNNQSIINFYTLSFVSVFEGKIKKVENDGKMCLLE